VHFPAKGHYVFRFSLSSGVGDWKARLSFQAGMGFNSPLVPISVLDDLSPKTLPPTYSFLSVNGDNLVISVLKESESGPTIILRGYEIEGASVETPVTFLGIVRRLRATNLVEEDAENSDQQVLRLKPFEIKTVRLSLAIPERIAETRH
jgi:alpha-mannosidase